MHAFAPFRVISLPANLPSYSSLFMFLDPRQSIFLNSPEIPEKCVRIMEFAIDDVIFCSRRASNRR